MQDVASRRLREPASGLGRQRLSEVFSANAEMLAVSRPATRAGSESFAESGAGLWTPAARAQGNDFR